MVEEARYGVRDFPRAVKPQGKCATTATVVVMNVRNRAREAHRGALSGWAIDRRGKEQLPRSRTNLPHARIRLVDDALVWNDPASVQRARPVSNWFRTITGLRRERTQRRVARQVV